MGWEGQEALHGGQQTLIHVLEEVIRLNRTTLDCIFCLYLVFSSKHQMPSINASSLCSFLPGRFQVISVYNKSNVSKLSGPKINETNCCSRGWNSN